MTTSYKTQLSYGTRIFTAFCTLTDLLMMITCFSAGHEDDPLQFIEGVMDEVICMPGTTTMNTKTEIR